MSYEITSDEDLLVSHFGLRPQFWQVIVNSNSTSIYGFEPISLATWEP